jgi:pimeloyl-ACP methyl ester carboxylesterase
VRKRRLVLLAFAAVACGALTCVACQPGKRTPRATSTPRPVPSPVSIRPEPDGIALADPTFVALSGARAEYGRLGGTAYQIEVPDRWNGRLVLFMHGYEDLGPTAHASTPKIRTYLILHGYAWGASSFSSTSLIPGRAADETAALWDLFVQRHGRPSRTYVTGNSMGGAATEIAAERYGDRFDGALALCGNAGNQEAVAGEADYAAAGAFVAGVTQAEYERSNDLGALVRDRIVAALMDPAAHTKFEQIMLALTGGQRSYDQQGFELEEDFNSRNAAILLAAHLAPNQGKTYGFGPPSPVTSDEFNGSVVRFSTNDAALYTFVDGNETTGQLEMPLLTLHTTGDGEVPIDQAQIYRRRVDASGKGELLVQRVVADPDHCGFTNGEVEAGFEGLVAWVEQGHKPAGDNVLVEDLRPLGTRFQLLPRAGAPAADRVPGAGSRVTLSGALTLDGAPFDARYLGATVRRDGLVTSCQSHPVIGGGRTLPHDDPRGRGGARLVEPPVGRSRSGRSRTGARSGAVSPFKVDGNSAAETATNKVSIP